MLPQAQYEALKNKACESDDAACFIERERILSQMEKEMAGYHCYDREARIFAALLDRVSTPVEPEDIFAGRLLMARPDPGMGPAKRMRYQYGEEACLRDLPKDTSMTFPSPLLYSFGHMTYDWQTLLQKGYRGVLEGIWKNAKRLGDPESQLFASNAQLVIETVRRFALRYADSAQAAGNIRAAEALRRVPYEPAYDLYSALSGIWLVHMIASCYVGARDFGFGHMDQYLYPFYLRELENKRMTRAEIAGLLACFLLKTNEICGRTVFNYNRQPIPSQSSKQYLIVGGVYANDLSEDILLAAKRNNMAQPVVTVLWSKDLPQTVRSQVFDTMNTVADKMHVYNYDVVRYAMEKRGLPEPDLSRLGYSGCCTMEIPGVTTRNEYYLNLPKILCGILGLLGDNGPDIKSLDDLLAALRQSVHDAVADYVDYISRLYGWIYTKHTCLFDCLLMCRCAEACRYPGEGGACSTRIYNIFLAGIATLGDSLYVLDRLCFQEKRLSLGSLREILLADFAGSEILLAEIHKMPHFGNDCEEADRYTVLAANTVLDGLDDIRKPEDSYIIGSFYSIDRSYAYGLELPATPDGRRRGAYISENQSPYYGVSQEGATAELCSVGRLPFGRTGAGGYNLTLSRYLDTPILQSLVESYFEQGGLHVGITYADRQKLEDAMVHPERYQDLTVRLYGYSEYFVKMPPWHQLEFLERTAH